MQALLMVAVVAPLLAAAIVACCGWQRAGATVTITAPAVVLAVAFVLTGGLANGVVRAGPLRADALAVVMLAVIGSVGLLATIASVSYLRVERQPDGEPATAAARRYGVLINLFLAAMTLAVLADNLGVMWVAIEATTVVTAFLVGHRGTRAALEATWKYVIICSVGIALAFLGTVLLYFAAVRAGVGHDALGFETLLHRGHQLDPGVTRLAAVLLLLGYGTKVGLAPFHTWLADAHSQAPAPVSALMSGVLLSVALTSLLRVKSIVDAALGGEFMRRGMLILGLLTLLIAAALMVGQRDYKRLLAYSSAEQMAFATIAASASPLAISAVLLLVMVHGLAKSALFIGAGHLQHAYHSTAISAVRGLLGRSRALGITLIVGLCVLAGLPPFGSFASEVGIARGMAGAGLAWPLGVAFVLTLVAVAALARHGGAMVLDSPDPSVEHVGVAGLQPAVAVGLGRLDSVALLAGVGGCLVLGVTTGPFAAMLTSAGHLLAGSS